MSIKRIIIVSLFLVIGACSNDQQKNNFTRLHELQGTKKIESDGVIFEVKKGQSDSTSNEESLIIGYPKDLIGESLLFGGVIIKVSDTQDENMGDLKLTNVVALATTELLITDNTQILKIKGRLGNSHETDPSQSLVEIPIKEINQAEKVVFLDLASLGHMMDINQYVIKNGEKLSEDKFEHIGSKTVAVDFSIKTLIFDVESQYKITTKNSNNEPSTKEVTLTTRWFMRLNSGLSPYFEKRKNTAGVGFFDTPIEGWIQRFPIHDLASRPVKYYVKNFPPEVRTSILSALEDWNHKLQSTLGHDLLTYEIIESNDPRYDQIVTGDVRFNVLEWDSVNKASYGGLGPSIANPISGENFAAQTLIQGPTILEIYKKWFKVSTFMNDHLMNHTLSSDKKELEKSLISFLSHKKEKLDHKANFEIRLNQLSFHVPSRDPRLQDSLAVDPTDYLEIPQGYTFDTYMNGYWRDLAAHELGHNLGLRHNFKGNLADSGTSQVGSVSRSVMEYLSRTHRHLSRVSEYDVMAIAYGYLGKAPAHLDWFCTDENQALYSYKNSAECSNDDATNDPVSFFEDRINRGLDLILNRGNQEGPEWTMKEASGILSTSLSVLATYVTSAPFTSSTWTNFFGKEGRPTNHDDIPQFMIEKINNLICSESLDKEASAKSTEEGKLKAQENLKSYRESMAETLNSVPSPWPLVNKKSFPCL